MKEKKAQPPLLYFPSISILPKTELKQTLGQGLLSLLALVLPRLVKRNLLLAALSAIDVLMVLAVEANPTRQREWSTQTLAVPPERGIRRAKPVSNTKQPKHFIL